MSPGVQQHILPGSKHRLLSMVQKYDGYVDDRHRSSRRGKSLPVQRKIQYLQHRDGILLGKPYSNLFYIEDLANTVELM